MAVIGSAGPRVCHVVAVVLAAVLCPARLLAQPVPEERPVGEEPPAAVQIATTVAGLYDDNLFWDTEAAGDFLVRLTPALTAQRRTPTLTLLSSYTFDAERYSRQSTLSTATARQRAFMSASGRPNGATAWLVEGSFATTTTPADFNVTTGVAPGRYRARNGDVRGELTRALTPTTTLQAAYVGSVQLVRDLADSDTNMVEVSLARKINARDTASVRGQVQRFGFDPEARIVSEVLVVGYARQLAPRVNASVEAGARHTLESFQPEVVAKLILERARTRVLVDYTASQSTAVGIVGAIDVQRYHALVTHRLTQRTEAVVRGTVFFNQLGQQTSRVTQFATELRGPIHRRVSFAITYATDLLRGNLYREFGNDVALTRNVVSVGITLIPWRTP